MEILAKGLLTVISKFSSKFQMKKDGWYKCTSRCIISVENEATDVMRSIRQRIEEPVSAESPIRMTSCHEQPCPLKTFSSNFSGIVALYLPFQIYLPCLLCLRCMMDTCIPEEKMLKDSRRLYAHGRLYHIVERRPFKFGRYPPVVRTAVPVDGRFEHIVLSCNDTSDLAITWIEREAQRAMDLMLEKDRVMEIPAKQRMERQETMTREHIEEYKAALQRVVSVSVLHAYLPPLYETFDESEDGQNPRKYSDKSSVESSRKSKNKESWNELIELFDKGESGHLVLKKQHRDD
ncbi:hypothetical protein DITRI_Ditri07aG0085500 [Diplodiscus trichospermus]